MCALIIKKKKKMCMCVRVFFFFFIFFNYFPFLHLHIWLFASSIHHLMLFSLLLSFFGGYRHSLLFNYGLSEDGNDFSPDDADANLVPELVERVALPILHHELAHCWDIFSTRETKNAVSATNLVIRYIPASSEALGELLAVVHKRLYKALTNFMVYISHLYYIFLNFLQLFDFANAGSYSRLLLF